MNASRRACLVARFGDIYAQERLDAETLLRTYISDTEMVQRIIYIAALVRKKRSCFTGQKCFIKYYGWTG